MITFPVYQKINTDEGPAFQCLVCDNGRSAIMFGGGTAEEAACLAKEWALSNLDTPERREKLAERAAAAAERRKSKKQDGGIFG